LLNYRPMDSLDVEVGESEETGNISTDLYLEKVAEKGRVVRRRISKFGGNGNGDQHRTRHWANHTGRYRDPELERGPKFYHSQRPVRDHTSIRNYGDLLEAVKSIFSGESSHDHYTGLSSLDRERLRTAQSLRDRGIYFKSSYIARLGYTQLRQLSTGSQN